MNHRLYLPEYSLSGRDPSFGREMDLSLVMASLMNRWGEDILPEEVAYTMLDFANTGVHNAAYAVAAAACCGYPSWQGWLDLKELRAQIHDGCSVGVEMETRLAGQKEPVRVWMALRGFGHDDEVMANFVLLNDPTADSGAVARTMAVADFQRYFTGRAIVLRPKPRTVDTTRPRRIRCGFQPAGGGEWFFTRKGVRDPLPEEFSGWIACTIYDGVAHATTANKTFHRMERTPDGGVRFPADLAGAQGRCCLYAVDQTGSMRVAEVVLTPPPPSAG